MVRHIIVLMCHVCGIYVFVSSCKCYSRLVNVCHGFVPSCIRYFCHANVFHAHACHAIVGHAIVTSCKCFSCKRDHVNVLHTSASSRVPRWLQFLDPFLRIDWVLWHLWYLVLCTSLINSNVSTSTRYQYYVWWTLGASATMANDSILNYWHAKANKLGKYWCSTFAAKLSCVA